MIYPNPFANQFTLEYSAALKGPVQLELFDLNGQRIVSWQEHMNKGKNRVTKVIDHLSSGIYILQMKTTDGQSIRRKLSVVN